VFLSAVYLPKLDRKPILDEIVTVDLVSLPDIVPTPAAPAPSEPLPVASKPKPVTPPEVEPVVSIPEPEPAAPEPEVVIKPISIKPSKRKITKKRDTRLEEEKQRERLAQKKKREEAERRRKLAQARQAEQRALDEKRRAQEELERIRRENRSIVGANSHRSGSSSSKKQVNSIVLKNYLIAMQGQVASNWILPDFKVWPSGLETVVEFTVHRDGRVSNLSIKKSSGDNYYDQFVLKTVRSSMPLPKFPTLLKKNTLDCGLRFRPSGVRS
jgi:TonB family protein